MDEIKKKLDDEIESGLNTLSTMSVDNSKYGEAADNVARLYKLKLETEKANSEADEKIAKADLEELKADRDYEIRKDEIRLEEERLIKETESKSAELENDQKKLRNERIAAIVGAVLTAATFVGGLVFEGHWYKTGFEFENTGTYVGQTFKWFRGNHRPKFRK